MVSKRVFGGPFSALVIFLVIHTSQKGEWRNNFLLLWSVNDLVIQDRRFAIGRAELRLSK